MGDVLLTGATGLLGSRVLADLLSEHSVTALARYPPRAPGGAARWIQHDLAQPVLPDGLPRAVDAVIHLAQSRVFREFPDRADEIFAVNVSSTALLLDWARRVGATRFILASTGGVYTSESSPHRENERIDSHALPSFYAASKYASEALALAYADYFSVIILRYFFIYGPDQDRSMLVPRMIASISEGRPIRLQGTRGIRLNPIYVADASRATIEGLQLRGSATLNIAGPEIHSLRDLAEMIGTHLGMPAQFDVAAESPVVDLVGDVTAMERVMKPSATRFIDVVGELCVPGNSAAPIRTGDL